jgi:hypothetical protein
VLFVRLLEILHFAQHVGVGQYLIVEDTNIYGWNGRTPERRTVAGDRFISRNHVLLMHEAS